MESKVLSIIQLMENDKVIHTIKIEDVQEYEFTFDSKKLSTLHITVKNLNMKDLNLLVSKPYEAYVLLGVKRIVINGQEKTFNIPAIVFKHLFIKDNSETIEIYFHETWDE